MTAAAETAMTNRALAYGFFIAALSAAPLVHAATPERVAIPDTQVYPESITSTAKGDLIIGSNGKGSIYRAKAGSDRAELWIDPVKSGLVSMFGVFADERASTLWVCSRPPQGASPEVAGPYSAVRAFDLKTGDAKASYPMPDGAGSVCNDFAVARDGTLYVAETRGGRVLRLKKGASALEVWIKDERLAGADGIALGGDGAVYLNTYQSGRLFRVQVARDGAPGPIVELRTSLKLDHPDGLRSLGGNRFVMVEGGAGRVTEVTVTGDDAALRVLKDGDVGLTGVTATKGMAWAVNAKMVFRNDPNLRGQDPGPFFAYAVPLK